VHRPAPALPLTARQLKRWAFGLCLALLCCCGAGGTTVAVSSYAWMTEGDPDVVLNRFLSALAHRDAAAVRDQMCRTAGSHRSTLAAEVAAFPRFTRWTGPQFGSRADAHGQIGIHMPLTQRLHDGDNPVGDFTVELYEQSGPGTVWRPCNRTLQLDRA
jgi:hypothetical protein